MEIRTKGIRIDVDDRVVSRREQKGFAVQAGDDGGVGDLGSRGRVYPAPAMGVSRPIAQGSGRPRGRPRER